MACGKRYGVEVSPDVVSVTVVSENNWRTCFSTGIDCIKIYAYALCGMEFEFDPVKSDGNARKHGIDFKTAQELWQDNRLIVLPSRFAEETRFLAVGKIKDKHWTAIFTERGEYIRLISVRRSRIEERGLYERNK